jgi:hypothetical protein
LLAGVIADRGQASGLLGIIWLLKAPKASQDMPKWRRNMLKINFGAYIYIYYI